MDTFTNVLQRQECVSCIQLGTDKDYKYRNNYPPGSLAHTLSTSHLQCAPAATTQSKHLYLITTTKHDVTSSKQQVVGRDPAASCVRGVVHDPSRRVVQESVVS